MKEETLPSFEETEELPSFEETEELPSFEDTEDLPSFSDTQSLEPVSTMQAPDIELPAPVIGYAAGKLGQAGIAKTGEKISGALQSIAQSGGTSPEQLKLIKENFPEFKAIDPVSEMNKLLASARGTNLEVNRLFSEAEKLLADKEITPDEYRDLVERAMLEQNRYGKPTFAKPISGSEIQKAEAAAIEKGIAEIKSREEKLLQEFLDLKSREALEGTGRAAELAGLTKKADQGIMERTKKKMKESPRDFGFQGLSKKEISDTLKKAKRKEVSALQTSLAKEFPSLKGTSILPSEEKAFQKILGMTSKADIPGYELQEMLRTLRDRGFTEEGQLSEKPAAATSAEIRKQISELSPKAGELMKAENIEIKKLDALEKAGYIKKEGSGTKTSIEMTDSQRNKLVKDLATAYDKNKPTDVVENLETLQKYLSASDFRKLELAAAKMAEKKSGSLDYVSFRPINAILQGLRLRKVSRAISTIPEALSSTFPKTATVAQFLGKGAYKALPAFAAGAAGFAAQAAEEGLASEESGATPDMPDYWLERGVRDPEEQVRLARLSSFREDLPQRGAVDEIPSPYEKPEIRERKEQILKAKEAGTLAPTYVEAPKAKILSSDDPSEISSVVQTLQNNQDKASQEYARVLNQALNATPREKEAILFGLNQQPAFRELVRKAKGDIEEESSNTLMD